MEKVLIVIPALNPPDSFLDYIDDLIKNDFDSILVINDGSREEFSTLFNQISLKKECIVLNHALNLGKGRGIKNSINYFLNLNNMSNYIGMIMVDSDGQHEIEDVKKIKKAMLKNQNKLYLGSRDFNEINVPPKSKFGNKFTTQLFWLLYGKKIKDTQTGLRGIPKSIAHLFIDLGGERFQYEMNMLISAIKNNISIEEVEIKTVYFDNNSETHFRPIKDSFQIISLLFMNFFKYMFSSISSFLVDIIFFQLFLTLLGNHQISQRIVISTIVARIISSIFNFYINKNIVFENKKNSTGSIFKYFGLVAIQMFISAELVTYLHYSIGLQEAIIKIIVDSILFFVSYRIQKFYIFNEKDLDVYRSNEIA